MKKSIIAIAVIISLIGCKKQPIDRPVWLETIQDTMYNLRLTYYGNDTGSNTMDEVFAYGILVIYGTKVPYTDTLKGITDRSSGQVYNWKIPISSGITSYTLMRWQNYQWNPITSGTTYH